MVLGLKGNEFFHLHRDPGEFAAFRKTDPLLMAHLRQSFLHRLIVSPPLIAGTGKSRDTKSDPTADSLVREQLKALGYVE